MKELGYLTGKVWRWASRWTQLLTPKLLRLNIAVFALSLFAAFSVLGETGLIAHYQFQQTGGSVTYDSSGHTNTAQVYGGATFVPLLQGGYAIKFGGTNGYVSCTGCSDIGGISNAITYEALVYLEQNSNMPGIVGIGTTPIQNACLTYYPVLKQARFYVNYGYGGTMCAANNIPAEEWIHLAATFNGESLKLYVNGVLASSATVTSQQIRATSDLYIGRMGATYSSGTVDEVNGTNSGLLIFSSDLESMGTGNCATFLTSEYERRSVCPTLELSYEVNSNSVR